VKEFETFFGNMSKHVIGLINNGEENAPKKQKIALPSKDEQKQLQQVDLLMKSNLLHLQVDQILDEVSGSSIMNKKKVIAWTESILSCLKSESSYAGVIGTNLNKKSLKKMGLKAIKVLSIVNSDDQSMQVTFAPPAAVTEIGSTQHHTTLSSMFNVDIAVTMPSSIFEPRDILNHRYFDKRRLYLLGLYQTLQKHAQKQSNSTEGSLLGNISFAAFKGDLRKAILVVQAPFSVSKAGSGGISLRIIPVIPEVGVFRAVQLKSGKNNVRPPHWTAKTNAEEEDRDVAALPATPLYNLAILEDMAVLKQHTILEKTVAPSPPLIKALVLLKIWLTQRGMRFSSDGFDGHCAGLLLSYMLLTRRVSPTATSALSAFQTLLTFIAEGHLLQCKLDFRVAELGSRKAVSQVHTSAGVGGLVSNGGAVVDEDSAVAISADLKHSSILDDSAWDFKRPLSLVHPIGPQSSGLESCRYNSLWRVSASSADMLQAEARRSLQELQQQESGSCFHHLFMQRRSFFECHDQFYHFRLEGAAIPFLENSSIHVSKADLEESPNLHSISEMPAAERHTLRNMLLHCPAADHFAAKAVQVVGRGLGDRAVAVHSHIQCVVPTASDGVAEASDAASEVSAHTPQWAVLSTENSSSITRGSSSSSSKVQCDWVVSIAVVLDKEKLDRRVDRGPSASTLGNIPDIAADPALLTNKEQRNGNVDDELHRFRDFWGPRVQLRRFKDGAIIESVVWDTPTPPASAASDAVRTQRVGCVVEQVTRFVLGRHLSAVCGENGSLVRAVNSQLESELLASSLNGASTSDDNRSRRAVEALDRLRGILTSQIKNLPLNYEALMAVAPELRYTAMYPPIQHPIILAASGADAADGKGLRQVLKQYSGRRLSLLAAPLRVLLQAESSGKWPLEAEAIKKTKLAMLLRTRSELLTQFKITSVIHEDSLDVCFEGYVFRLQIVATNEVEAVQLAGGKISINNSIAAVQLNVARNVAVAPLHHLSVRGLRTQFPSYTGAVRLMSVWAAQHCFSGHLCLELIELIVAYEYLHPFTALPPASPLSGFYRALLRLGDHSWDTDPLIVDLSGESRQITGNAALQLQIVSQFRALRDAAAANNEVVDDAPAGSDLPAQVRRRLNAPMYVVSSADKAHNYWPSLATKSPERVVLGLIVRAAKVTSQRVLTWMQQSQTNAKGNTDTVPTERVVEEVEVRDLMSSNAVLDNCDIILKCNKSIVNKTPDEGPAFANLTVFANTSPSEAALSNLVVREAECTVHPIQEELVRRLRATFGSEALFFWNALSGKEIGVVWRPRVLQPSSFAVLACKGRAVQDGASTTEANIAQLLCEMLDLSDGLLVQAEEVSK